jgi:hypothetical protein
MALTAERQRQIIAKESAWVDDGFGQLDLTAFPALNELAPQQARDDGRFAKHWDDTPLSASATALRNFVSDPDAESLERVGDEIGHEGFRSEVRQSRGESIAERFKLACPDYIPTKTNYDTVVETLSWNALSAADQEGTIDEQVAALIDGGFWTVSNLTATYNALTAEGLLDIAAGSTRNLSAAERLRVTRMAQSGRVDAAIGEHLRCSLGGEEPSMELLDDPDYRQACDQAVWFVFENITNDYVPSPEREAYIQRHCAGRPITLALLQSAWAACQVNEQRHQRGELLDQYEWPQDTQPPSAREIDALSDDAVDDLYHRSLRAYADSFRRAPGVLA